ncbi:glycosyltransferase involved in cell wall biosynthesis [Catenibacillus scindens]|uniref:Glycosyltransferase involved in cell wall biosynthesis n=1 Tax=Catenibacillus scindens TaxID=673271 RepID=A0A7W8M554_9FIRM|nr:glycosyltransferase [Catenibacillus scindens]MBB5264172.1 glycosyltransferase involved in cell wall biosynthesis [Catenibacillus scindens]
MISYIIPVYNGGKYLEKCLQSIIRNSDPDDEIIIVDDGSIDETAEICDRYEAKYIQVTAIHKVNGGVSSARNIGLNHAKGEWIVFVDSDDLLIANVNSKLLDVCASTEFVAFTHKAISEKNKSFCGNGLILKILSNNNPNEVKLNAVWAKAYKRKMIENNHIRFNENLFHGEDMLFNLDVALECGKVEIVNCEMYQYIPNTQSAIHKYQKNSLENERTFCSELLARLNKCNDSRITDQYNYLIVNGVWIITGQNICHSENHLNLSERIHALKDYVLQGPCRLAIDKVELNRLNLKKAAMVWLLRHKLYGLVVLAFSVKSYLDY